MEVGIRKEGVFGRQLGVEGAVAAVDDHVMNWCMGKYFINGPTFGISRVANTATY